MADAESTEVLNAILAPSTPSQASEAGGEAAPKPADAPSRAADGRFASNEPAEADAGDDEVTDAILEGEEPADDQPADDKAEGEEEEAEAEGEEQPEEEAPKNLDEYTVEVAVDGRKEDVTLGELKRNWSAGKYVEKNIHEAVEYRKTSNAAADAAVYRTYAVLQQEVDHLKTIEEVVSKFVTPQENLEALRHQNPQAYALKRVAQLESQEKVQKIQQEIQNKQSQQAEIIAHAKAQRVEDETRILLQKLPALADPQKAPVVMGKIREVAQSYGVSDEELNALDGHVPLMVLAELAWLREQMAGVEARMKRPTGEQPRPKTLIRPGTAKPAQSSSKKLEAQLLTRARKSGKPDDVAATLLVARKR